MQLTERLAIAPLLAPADVQSAGGDYSVKISELHSVLFLLVLGAITGNDSVVKIYTGATEGAKTTEQALNYRLSGADIGAASGSDQFGDRTTIAAGGTGLVFTDAADYNARVIAVDFDPANAPDGHFWVTLELDDGSASVLFASVIALGEPRYQANDVPTIVA